MKNVYHHHIHRAKIGLPIVQGRVELFRQEAPDDEWMDFVAQRGWIVFTQDYALHRQPAVVSLIKQHGAKVFYLWGAQATKFEAMRAFVSRYPLILTTAALTKDPFIYRTKKTGPFERVPLNG